MWPIGRKDIEVGVLGELARVVAESMMASFSCFFFFLGK